MPAKTRRPARRKQQKAKSSSWTFTIIAAIFILATPAFALIKINYDRNRLGNQIEEKKTRLANHKDVLNNYKADKERHTDKEYIFSKVKEHRLGLVSARVGQVRSISHFPNKLKENDLKIYSDNDVASRRNSENLDRQ